MKHRNKFALPIQILTNENIIHIYVYRVICYRVNAVSSSEYGAKLLLKILLRRRSQVQKCSAYNMLLSIFYHTHM